VITPTVLDMGAVVGESVEMLRRIIGENVAVELTPPSTRLAARLDRAQIEQVLFNLATNARDAMPGGGTLRIAVEAVQLSRADAVLPPEVAAGRYLCVHVGDTGKGMDAATRERIFEPFFTTKAPGRGTGLGLASVFGSVSQAGGFIHVCSELEAGTRFSLYFPRIDEAELEGRTERTSDAPARRGHEHILMVEDDEGVRAVVTLILTEAGYEVTQASTLAEARGLHHAHAASFSMVITDLVLPDGRGLELATELRLARPGLPVLCVSGYADGVGGEGLPPGVERLQKPFGAEELLLKVRALLDLADSQGAALSA
jgi:CheY-like chemotaxis protein